MPRILHVVESLDARLGGPPAVCLRLAAAQAARGHTVGIVCRAGGPRPMFPRETLDGIPGGDQVAGFAVAAGDGLLARARAVSVREFVHREGGSWDLLHIHAVWDPATRSAGLAAIQCGTPYVITPHGMLDRWGMRQGVLRPWKKRVALALSLGYVLRNASFLHALTESERDGLQHFGFGRSVEVVPNGIFLEEMADEGKANEFRRSHPEIGDAPFVLYLGRLHSVKGIDLLIAGFRRVIEHDKSIRLVIVGPDFGEGKRLRSLARRLGVADRVHFIDPIFGKGRFSALRECAVFCQMSRYEGFSVGILEALACGCPVVASENCSFPEIASAGAGRVVGDSPDQIATALIGYLQDPARRVCAGTAAKKLVAKSFTWEQVARRMDSAYASVKIPGFSDPDANSPS